MRREIKRYEGMTKIAEPGNGSGPSVASMQELVWFKHSADSQ
jgi:hypothetical protein